MSKTLPISEFTSKIGSGATPKGGKEAYLGGEYTLIRSQNVHDFFFSHDGLAYINSKQAKALDNVKVKQGDVLLNITGDSIARCCSVPQDVLPARVNQHVSIIRCKNIEDSEYLKYYLINMKPYLMKICGVGGTRNALTKEAIGKLPITFQNNHTKLANILSTLDSKIELNNKINKELEIMAKTLYDYWFVQFDFPNENGKPYKSSGGKMVYNKELKREIPEGWDVKDLEEICEIYQPQTISEKEMIKDGKYFVFGANGIVGMYDKYNHEDSEVTITCRGNSCGTLNRTLPYSWITGNAMVVRFKDDKIHNEYLMQLLSWTKMDNVITGSAQPQITRTNLAPLKILIPKNNILDNFSQKMEFNINLQLKNIEQNQELAKLRDWLLPMLMNGQVKVEI